MASGRRRWSCLGDVYKQSHVKDGLSMLIGPSSLASGPQPYQQSPGSWEAIGQLVIQGAFGL
jgi:hypothetical protein